LPHKIGYYLGLTGARISLNDCIAIGLIDHHVKSEQFPDLIYALADTSFEMDEHETITNVIKTFSVPAENSTLLQQSEVIENCFSEKTIEKMIHALENTGDNKWNEVASILKTKSPTSLKVTLHALQEAENLDFDDAIQMEFRISRQFLQGHDFFEGIRAVLIDKDQTPHWKPETLKEVTKASIDKYFEPVEVEL
jgi:enoyl-CoA hydratase